jgi:hypothetical protein
MQAMRICEGDDELGYATGRTAAASKPRRSWMCKPGLMQLKTTQLRNLNQLYWLLAVADPGQKNSPMVNFCTTNLYNKVIAHKIRDKNVAKISIYL